MNAVKMSLVALVAGLGLVAAEAATAQNSQRVGPTRPKVVSKSHQPVGTPHKASSFAPHPTTRRVFGDPIQPPIVHNVPATTKKSPPK
jgi:hypothetical protein